MLGKEGMEVGIGGEVSSISESFFLLSFGLVGWNVDRGCIPAGKFGMRVGGVCFGDCQTQALPVKKKKKKGGWEKMS